MESILTKNQKKILGWKVFSKGGQTYRIKAVIRYDDECGNGHNSFSITGEIERKAGNGRWVDDSGGCIHEEIAKHFPEVKHLIKWHLVDSNMPMHYFANTLFLAGSKDCWGKEKGEPYRYEKSIKFDCFPVVFEFKQNFIEWVEQQTKGTFKVLAVPHKDKDGYKYSDKYTFAGFGCEWYECPFDTEAEAKQFEEAFNNLLYSVISVATAYGEGKEPELDSARNTAIWPEATLEQLQSREALEKHLEEIMQQFKKDVETLGFVY